MQLHPSIVINGQVYYGDVKGKQLAKAICSAYKEAPDECELSWKINVYEQGLLDNIDNMVLPELSEDYLKNEAEASRGPQNLEVNNVETTPQQFTSAVVTTYVTYHYNKTYIYSIIAVVVVINLGILMYCRRRMKQQSQQSLNMHVQTAVSQYFALSGQEEA